MMVLNFKTFVSLKFLSHIQIVILTLDSYITLIKLSGDFIAFYC